MFVLPAPVGAHINILSLLLKAWSNTILCTVLRNSDSKHFEYLGPMKSRTLILYTSSLFIFGSGSILNWIYSGLSTLLRVGIFWMSSLSLIVKKSNASVASSTFIHWFTFYFSIFFFFWPPASSNFTLTSPSKNLLSSKNSHNYFRKVTKYFIACSSLGSKVLSWWERSSFEDSLNSRIFLNRSKSSNFQN